MGLPLTTLVGLPLGLNDVILLFLIEQLLALDGRKVQFSLTAVRFYISVLMLKIGLQYLFSPLDDCRGYYFTLFDLRFAFFFDNDSFFLEKDFRLYDAVVVRFGDLKMVG